MREGGQEGLDGKGGRVSGLGGREDERNDFFRTEADSD